MSNSSANPGPTVWAFVSLLGGFALAYPFLRQEDVSDHSLSDLGAVKSGIASNGRDVALGFETDGGGLQHQSDSLRNAASSPQDSPASDWQLGMPLREQGIFESARGRGLGSGPRTNHDGSGHVKSAVGSPASGSQAIMQPMRNVVTESPRLSEASSLAASADAQCVSEGGEEQRLGQTQLVAIDPDSLPSTGSELPSFAAQQPPLPRWVKGESSLDELIDASAEEMNHSTGAAVFGELNASKPAPFQPWCAGSGESKEVREGGSARVGPFDSADPVNGTKGRTADLARRYSPWDSPEPGGVATLPNPQPSGSLALQRSSGWPDRSITIDWDALAGVPVGYAERKQPQALRGAENSALLQESNRPSVSAASASNATYGTRLVTGSRSASGPTIGATLNRGDVSLYAPRFGGSGVSNPSSSNVIRQPGMQDGTDLR